MVDIAVETISYIVMVLNNVLTVDGGSTGAAWSARVCHNRAKSLTLVIR